MAIKESLKSKIRRLIRKLFGGPKPQWHLDTHSTILSRKHSYHKRVGKLMYVKTKYER